MSEKRNDVEVVCLVNELFNTMAHDIRVLPYENELEESYAYRIIYSALGLWCLKSALSIRDGEEGISKHAQSILLHNLSKKYIQLFPETNRFLFDNREDIAVFLRNTYEKTGYLITQENNYNVLNNDGVGIKLSDDEYLYLGLPSDKYDINGLGIYSHHAEYEINLWDYLIRDTVRPEDYVDLNYNECDFEERDIDSGELEFFDSVYGKAVSRSWSSHLKSDFSIARKGISGPYYRVIFNNDGKLLYKDENNIDDLNAFAGGEFRRLYVALRHYYNNPMLAFICPIDSTYTHIKLLGQLPNREYFFMLLNGWPKNGITDKTNFIVRNERVDQIKEVLSNLGFAIRNGEFYG